jgi:hypothetical protein
MLVLAQENLPHYAFQPGEAILLCDRADANFVAAMAKLGSARGRLLDRGARASHREEAEAGFDRGL